MSRPRFKLWDLPTRLCHWALALAVGAAVLTGQLGGNLIDWHGRIGLAIVGLVAFRLAWGIVGSTYARFAHFRPSPARIRAYLAGEWTAAGHNPLGALAVFGLLGLLTAQVASGLVANDDIAFVGPLFELVGKDWSDRLSGFHHLLSDLLLGLVGLHLAAIVFYVRFRKKSLVKPMITGWQEGEAEKSAQGGRWPALAAALVVAGLAVYGASGAWLPPPLPPAESAPAW